MTCASCLSAWASALRACKQIRANPVADNSDQIAHAVPSQKSPG